MQSVIRIQEQRVCAPSMGQTIITGRSALCIRLRQVFYPRVGGPSRSHYGLRIFGAAVIYYQYFKVRKHLLSHRIEDKTDKVSPVIGGNDNTEKGSVHENLIRQRR